MPSAKAPQMVIFFMKSLPIPFDVQDSTGTADHTDELSPPTGGRDRHTTYRSGWKSIRESGSFSKYPERQIDQSPTTMVVP